MAPPFEIDLMLRNAIYILGIFQIEIRLKNSSQIDISIKNLLFTLTFLLEYVEFGRKSTFLISIEKLFFYNLFYKDKKRIPEFLTSSDVISFS